MKPRFTVTFHVSRLTFHVASCYLPSAICYPPARCPATPRLSSRSASSRRSRARAGRWGTPSCPRSRRPRPKRTPAAGLGRYQVLVVAFNDDLNGPNAAAQAQALALDPEVLAVVGPWSAETVAAAAPILAAAGLPVLASAGTSAPPPGEKWGDAALADAATLAGDNTRVLLDALAADIRAHGRPTRAGVAATLNQ